MNKRWIFFLIINLFLLHANAQITTPPKGKRIDAQQKEQIQIDEQLAGQYFREHDYEKAALQYHFQQYVECLVQLKDYDKAEKELKSYLKKDPNNSKGIADLVYVYTLQGKTDRAKKCFDEVVKEMAPNGSVIRNLSYAFQSRALYDMALGILEKGNKLLDG